MTSSNNVREAGSGRESRFCRWYPAELQQEQDERVQNCDGEKETFESKPESGSSNEKEEDTIDIVSEQVRI